LLQRVVLTLVLSAGNGHPLDPARRFLGFAPLSTCSIIVTATLTQGQHKALVKNDRVKQSYLEVIKAMAELDPPLFVFGGIAEDALLDRKLSRPHGDIDIMVLRDELSQGQKQCEHLGFSDLEVYYEPIGGRPLVLGGQEGGLNLELGLCDRDGEGYYFTVIDEAGDLCNIYPPSDMFAYPATVMEGTPIQTISPLALYQIRAGLGFTKSFGALRPKDIAAQRRLRTTFLADQAEAALRPRIEKLSSAEQH
jgi:hypothetical protein